MFVSHSVFLHLLRGAKTTQSLKRLEQPATALESANFEEFEEGETVEMEPVQPSNESAADVEPDVPAQQASSASPSPLNNHHQKSHNHPNHHPHNQNNLNGTSPFYRRKDYCRVPSGQAQKLNDAAAIGGREARAYVGNLPPDTQEYELFSAFKKYGTIMFVEIRGRTGYVQFDKRASLLRAIRTEQGRIRIRGRLVGSYITWL